MASTNYDIQIVIDAQNKAQKQLESVSRELKNVKGQFGGMKQATQQSTKSLNNMGTALAGLGIGAIIKQNIGEAINTFKDFQFEMKGVQAVSKATEEQYKLLSMQAKEMGRTTQFSAKQSANAMKFLGMAGLETEEIMKALEPTLDLAASTTTDLGESADIVTNVMGGFQAQVEQLPKFVDVLATTTTSANTNMTELGEAMKFAGPKAKQLGISIEETSAAIGVLANKGIKGTLAGTGLQGVLTKLTSPTKIARQELDKLGVSVFDNEGNFKGLTPVLAEVQDKMKGLSQEQRVQSMFNIAGALHQKTFANLLSSTGGELETLTKELENATGAAKKMADIKMDSLEGDTLKRKSAIEGLKISIGGSLEPVLRSMFSLITPIISKITERAEKNPKLMATIIGIVAGLGALVVGATVLVPILGAVATGIGVLLGPIGLVIGAITLLATARATNFGGIQEKTVEARTSIKTIFSDGLNFIKQQWNDIFGETTGITKQEMNLIISTLKTGRALITGNLKVSFIIIKTIIKTAFTTIKSIVKTAITIIIATFKFWVDTIRNAIALIKALFKGDFKGAWKIVKKQVDDTKKYFGTVFNSIIKNAKERGKNMINMFADGLSEGITVVKGKIVEIAETLKDYLGFGSPTKKGPGSESGKRIPNFIGMVTDGLNDGKTPIRREAEAIAEELGKGLNKVEFENYTNRIETALEKQKELAIQMTEDQTEAFNTIKESGQEAFDGIGESMIKSFDKITDFGNEIANVEQQMKKLGTDTSTNVATEFVNVGKEIEDIKKEIIESQKKAKELLGDKTKEKKGEKRQDIQENIDKEQLKQIDLIAKQKQLEEELALAKANTTEEEIKRAQMIAEESGVEKILREAEEKKAVLQTELDSLKSQKIQEEEVFKNLAQQKIDFERQYLDALGLSTKKQAEQYDLLIEKAVQLRLAKGEDIAPTMLDASNIVGNFQKDYSQYTGGNYLGKITSGPGINGGGIPANNKGIPIIGGQGQEEELIKKKIDPINELVFEVKLLNNRTKEIMENTGQIDVNTGKTAKNTENLKSKIGKGISKTTLATDIKRNRLFGFV